jgi:hypothetical protein
LSIYSPVITFPTNGISVSGSINNTFTWNFQGTDTQLTYRILIYKNSDNSQIYDSNVQSSENEYHVVPSGTLTNNNLYKIKIITTGVSGSANSAWVLFYAHAIPTLTLGLLPTDQQIYTFSCLYNQANNVPVKYYEAFLYIGSDLNNPISESGIIYPSILATNGSTLEYEFDGMQDATEYAIQFRVTTQYGVEVSTNKQTFTVNYEYPPDANTVIVTPNNSDGSITINWDRLNQILGIVSGSSSYVVGKFGQGLSLTNGSYLYYTETIPEDYTIYGWFKLPNGFIGDIIKLGIDDTGMRVFFDGTYFGFQLDNFITCGFKNHSDIFNNFILIAIQYGKLYIKTNSKQEVISW